MITLIYTKQSINLSGPVDDTGFFVRNRLILVLGQKGNSDYSLPPNGLVC